MPERSHYPNGVPCWPELITPDLAVAIPFYRKVFGWTCQELGPEIWHYVICMVDTKPVAAMTPPAIGLEPSMAKWNPYFATSDVDASTVRVEANNGKIIVLPTAIRSLGRLAMAADPEDATFGLWQAGAHPGSRLYAEPGAMCWNELHARNAKAADGFYEALFGYEQEQIGDGVDFDYAVWKIRNEPVCGRVRMPYDWGEGTAPYWKTYIAVADCDVAEARIRQEGGTVLIGGYDTPHGRVAVVTDPAGARFAICQQPRMPGTT